MGWGVGGARGDEGERADLEREALPHSSPAPPCPPGQDVIVQGVGTDKAQAARGVGRGSQCCAPPRIPDASSRGSVGRRRRMVQELGQIQHWGVALQGGDDGG